MALKAKGHTIIQLLLPLALESKKGLALGSNQYHNETMHAHTHRQTHFLNSLLLFIDARKFSLRFLFVYIQVLERRRSNDGKDDLQNKML